MWPDLAKFRHFGNSVQVFGNFLTVYFLFGKMLSLLWQTCDIIGLICIVGNGQILKNNLTIWSHWRLPIFLPIYLSLVPCLRVGTFFHFLQNGNRSKLVSCSQGREQDWFDTSFKIAGFGFSDDGEKNRHLSKKDFAKKFRLTMNMFLYFFK